MDFNHLTERMGACRSGGHSSSIEGAAGLEATLKAFRQMTRRQMNEATGLPLVGKDIANEGSVVTLSGRCASRSVAGSGT
jgi:hypothetical protein